MKKNYKLLELVYNEIKNNTNITEREISEKTFYNERTIRRYVKKLKEKGLIESVNTGRKHYWIVK